MSYISYRLATIAAAVIFFLVILFVILWTGFFSSNTTAIARVYDKDQSTAPTSHQQSNETDRRQEDQRSESLMSDRSVAAPLQSNTTDISNEVLRQPIKDASKRQENSDEDFSSGNSKGEILPTDKGDLEYVKLVKISRNRYEDPPDEYSAHKRHHSGHFRHKSAKVWDPHPQYEFTAFGRHFHLLLSLDSSFIFPGMKITHVKKNTSKWEQAGQHLDCFYSGEVDGDPNSIVAVNLCGGMTGHMTTSTGSYLIKPAKRRTDDEDTSIESSLQHAIYRTSSSDSTLTNDLPRNHECGVIDYTENSPTLSFDDSSERRVYVGDEHRRRKRRLLWKNTSGDDFKKQDAPIRNQSRYELMARSRTYPSENDPNWSHQSVEADFDNYGGWRTRRAVPREYFIEVLIVADSMMTEYHADGLISYILVLMNTVTRIYKDPSIGNPISIAVVKIISTDEVFFTKKRDADGISASEMLKKFCSWQKRSNPDEPSAEHHDIAVLLTRENLCHNIDNKNCNTLGLAELGRMCSPGSSCAIVQDNGLSAAFTIAHEIGHVLNMPHDDDTRCTRFRNTSGKSETYNVMSRMMDDNSYPWEWSQCSRHYITEFLDSGYAQCLLDEPSKTMSKWSTSRFPGEVFTGDEQCELSYGTGAKLCSHEPQDVCKRLWCTAPLYDATEDCHTQHMPWADGTSCGKNRWCHRGECVSRQTLRPVDGQWGSWGSYGDCSRTCGGGIKKKFRECNNPPPQNGGNYCFGERVKYKNCGTKECPANTPDFREEQCTAFNNNNLDIRNLPRDVKWHAKYTRIIPEDRCKLYCQVDSNQYYILRDKVIDGTPCGPDTFHMCVNGRCRPAGCDNILNSSAKMDSCGVCKGDNSTCQKITGSFNSTSYGYTKVTKIPAGSSFIDIKQYGWGGSHNDLNYLALRYADREEYILNGKFLVMNRRVIMQPEMTIEYSGPEAVVERLNSSRPIKVDIILEVLSVGKIFPPQITYEYTVPKKILKRYTWVLSAWSSCTLSCQGMKYRRAECRGTEHKDVVPDGYCRAEEKPREESQICNNHCLFQWQVTSRTECSSHCGNGTRSVTFRCVHVLNLSEKSHTRQLPDYVCAHLEKPKEKEPCVGSCHDLRWNYGVWGTCSVTCGGGIQRRSANCVDSKGRPVADEKCLSQEKIVTKVCGQETCPRWDFGEWGPCSVTCGLGKRQRPYWCQVENHVVHANYCSGSPSQVSKVCDAGPCYMWHSSDWSPCSVTCGDGIRKREITCKDANNVVTKKTNCISSKQPEETTSCMPSVCPTAQTLPSVISTLKSPPEDPSEQDNDVNHDRIPSHKTYKWHSEPADERSRRDHCSVYPCPLWTTGEWSQCDVACGEGYQYRQVRCRSSRGTILPDNACVIRQKPRHVKKCEKPPCKPSMDNSFHRWRTSDWSSCSAECGEGTQRRNVTCHLVNAYGWLDPTPIDECPTTEKPAEEQPCKLKDCEYYWTAGNWKKCSHLCGRKGRQVRRLFCHNKDGKKVPRYNCPVKLKPPRKRKCNQRKCGPTTCAELQKRFRYTRDGEYSLTIGGRNMSIYCYDMSGREPKEYLTLPVGDKENFAEIYGKRLRNPQTCPFGGQRNESCHCVTDPGTIAGITAFKRVRIDVNKLYIIADDYRFSWTKGAKRVEFGKAGDCYSLANCPQGRFSINLTGTFFRISPEVSWTTQKSRAFLLINRINDQVIVGKCGGYCGFCAPMSGLKLDILPP